MGIAWGAHTVRSCVCAYEPEFGMAINNRAPVGSGFHARPQCIINYYFSVGHGNPTLQKPNSKGIQPANVPEQGNTCGWPRAAIPTNPADVKRDVEDAVPYQTRIRMNQQQPRTRRGCACSARMKNREWGLFRAEQAQPLQKPPQKFTLNCWHCPQEGG